MSIGWTYYTLLTPPDPSRLTNSEEIRDYLRKSRVDLNAIPREVEGIERVRDPYLLAHWRKRRWFAWEITRDEEPLGFDRLASLALFRHYLDFVVGVFRFVRTPVPEVIYSVEIEEFASGRVRVSTCPDDDPLTPCCVRSHEGAVI